MYKAFLFDLDGVIVDTAVFHYHAWKRLANEKIGADFTEEFNETLKGISRMDSLDRILAHAGVALDETTKAEYATLKNEWYLELVMQMTPNHVLPGVVDFLKQVREAGIGIALGSVSKNARLILERTEVIAYFDAIIDGTKITNSKPHPEVFLKGAAALSVEPPECVVFEDAVAGVEAAKRANMKAVGIGENDVLKQADIVVSGFSDLQLNQLLQKLS
jgi:beta-phosphoglucomutase